MSTLSSERMASEFALPPIRKSPAWNYFFFIAVVVAVAAVLTMAMTFQYENGELPCPLCLLQRLALFGFCFTAMMHFRFGFSQRHTGWALLFALFLLIVSARQALLDIYPRPGHAYIGSAIFGIHMPIWSFFIALCLIAACALNIAVTGNSKSLRGVKIRDYPSLSRLATVVGIYVIALCAINFVSVIVQCGGGQCHTSGYLLLGGV